MEAMYVGPMIEMQVVGRADDGTPTLVRAQPLHWSIPDSLSLYHYDGYEPSEDDAHLDWGGEPCIGYWAAQDPFAGGLTTPDYDPTDDYSDLNERYEYDLPF